MKAAPSPPAAGSRLTGYRAGARRLASPGLEQEGVDARKLGEAAASLAGAEQIREIPAPGLRQAIIFSSTASAEVSKRLRGLSRRFSTRPRPAPARALPKMRKVSRASRAAARGGRRSMHSPNARRQRRSSFRLRPACRSGRRCCWRRFPVAKLAIVFDQPDAHHVDVVDLPRVAGLDQAGRGVGSGRPRLLHLGAEPPLRCRRGCERIGLSSIGLLRAHRRQERLNRCRPAGS